jgi:23S rRNA pseudouridine2605 synthase
MSGPSRTKKQADPAAAAKGERIAKVMARAGLCSRREAERWVEDGRVAVNGETLTTPAITVTATDKVIVDGRPLPVKERTRLWLYHKPRGLVTTNSDPQGRPTVFSALPADLPRTMSVGRLDINTEGLLLLTNDGGLARLLELPATGWLRRYRVRAHGRVAPEALEALKDGVTIDGMIYGAIEAVVDREQGANLWLTIGLREGKNREVKRVLDHLGLTVNRLIRISYGPLQLGDLAPGEVQEIRGRMLRDQLGEKLIAKAGLDFDTELRKPAQPAKAKPAQKKKPGARERKGAAALKGGRKSGRSAMMDIDTKPPGSRPDDKKRSAKGRPAKAGGKPAGNARRRRPV